MICIQYARPASGKDEKEVFGLDVAVRNFLTAYFRHSAENRFICRPADLPSFDHFKALAASEGRDPESILGLDPRHPKHNLQSVGCLFRPDPLIADLAWRREQVPGPGFAICGLVHTMSGERIARAVGDLITAPSDATDALICPSEAIRDAVQNLWAMQTEYLNRRFGGTFRCPVQTPVIPLGVDTDKFANLTTPDKRASQRASLGVTEDEVILLFVGRLSFATKAHPLPLWMAAERAATKASKKVRLVMFGYFKPKDMEFHFRNLATDIARNLTIDFIANDDPRFPDGLWAAADIFTSFSDNIQESFGLTPIEALAAGLPAVISDWNGYRGSVRDGHDGFRVPTTAPPPSAGLEIAEYYYNQENYGVSLMGATQSTSIDIDRAAAAMQMLIEDPEMRARFGANGRRRARDVFDWKHIIKAYEKLWNELADRRRASPRPVNLPEAWPAVHPAFPNPLAMFESFPSRHLKPDDRLTIIMSRDEIEALIRHEMNYFLPDLIIPKPAMLDLADAIRAAGSPTMRMIMSAVPAHEKSRVWRSIGWILKHGVGIYAEAA